MDEEVEFLGTAVNYFPPETTERRVRPPAPGSMGAPLVPPPAPRIPRPPSEEDDIVHWQRPPGIMSVGVARENPLQSPRHGPQTRSRRQGEPEERPGTMSPNQQRPSAGQMMQERRVTDLQAKLLAAGSLCTGCYQVEGLNFASCCGAIMCERCMPKYLDTSTICPNCR